MPEADHLKGIPLPCILSLRSIELLPRLNRFILQKIYREQDKRINQLIDKAQFVKHIILILSYKLHYSSPLNVFVSPSPLGTPDFSTSSLLVIFFLPMAIAAIIFHDGLDF